MVTDSFIDYIKTEDTYSDIVQAFEIGFDMNETSNYELNIPLPKWKTSYLINDRWNGVTMVVKIKNQKAPKSAP